MKIKNLHKLIKGSVKRITPLDYIILFVTVVFLLVFLIYFRRENAFIEIRLKLTDPDVRNMSARSLDEYAMNFRVGDKEYNELGQVVNEIVRVDSYRTSSQGQVIYLNIRSKALYNPRKKQYSIQGKPVVAGQSFVFVFSPSKAQGIIVDFPGFTSTKDMPLKKLIVRSQLQDEQRAYSDTYGVHKYIAQAIKPGDVVTDSNGVVLAKVLSVEVLPANRTIVTNNNTSMTIVDQELKDAFYTLEITAFKYGGRYYLYDYIPISIGQALPLNFPLISILPIIIDIK
jgi:hypothetical protein